ncbi:Anthocyanidin 5,3-O-glucosyltransferase [Glycine soja]|uniref:Glycosyltransferase n=1 Tax=Glycine soja TaxID=3848 RepID=A0A0B2SKY6_GLYSO|nr:Anthocyanidin 5,3-O-glucosyltransferase [Glycine soja]
MKDSIVLYPALGRGHLVSMVELGKLILTHQPSLSITILILTPPSNTPSTPKGCDSTSQYIAAVTAATPSITFHHLPPTQIPTILPPHILSLELSRSSNHHLPHVITSLSKTLTLKAIVLDFMNFCAKQVTNALNIPTFFYYTSGASSLATFLQLPVIHETTTKSIKDLNTHLSIPGLPKIDLLDLPKEVHDRASQSYKLFHDIATCMRDSDGVIVNTCDPIEGRVIKAALCKDGTLPPLFFIGPLISAPYEEDKGCLSWLDSQPSQSVVLLSFGSLGRFSRAQVKEMAVGLEKSEQRFLWVLRSELVGVDSVEPSLDELLPEGFVERTKGRGMVVRNWAPQVRILSHDSVGGFVTHCGWNSVLEAVCEGVPMVAWPLYAEQRLNRVIMVQDMKVALAVNEDKDGFVSGTELRDRVRELMDSMKGKEIRQRVFEMKIGAKKAKAEEGSSLVAFQRLVQLWNQ